MDVEDIWRAVERERLAVADLLAGLAPAEWERPSLCVGWRVREVAAHLTMQDRIGPLNPLGDVLRARGNFNRMVDATARRRAGSPPAALVAGLRAIAGSRRLGIGMKPHDALLDTLCHGQDIAVPLGRWHPVPPGPARVAAERVWSMGFPFGARRRLRGFRLVATDVPWTRGDGSVVSGPIAALLLLVAGRTATLGQLTGAGAVELRRRPTAAGRDHVAARPGER
ncbi:MAG TPA: maleylpyruvate isomerase family mycothiol-dependent enzyme [Pilimelia sp.]|nr:maleylpyruvate isomerase family mycothiol-dependent enzyme [Pilimelia sp.]